MRLEVFSRLSIFWVSQSVEVLKITDVSEETAASNIISPSLSGRLMYCTGPGVAAVEEPLVRRSSQWVCC